MVTVSGVEPGSLAEQAGFLPGDILLSVNGNNIADVLDYRYYITEPSLSLLVHRGPELFTFTIEKEEYEDIGLAFETYLMDKKHACRNGCIFCFIDQNPRGMRPTIYFKDDDSRLSFLLGNYVTLTNLKDADIDRIIKMRLSPINISVHTTDPALRCQMMKNKHAGSSLAYLQKLADAGIGINAQIVLCRGVNDGAALDKTLSDLAAYGEAMQSVAVVPAGLTKHREGLYPLTPFSAKEAADVISQVEAFGRQMKKSRGTRLVFCSDEFYLTAGLPLPEEEFYEGYPQLENGVGMITSLRTEFFDALPYLAKDYDLERPIHASIATGKAAYPLISELVEALKSRCPHLDCPVYAIENHFFGETITVAGLVCGCDLKEQLAGKELGDFLLIPSVMLRDEGDRFLDDVTCDELSQALGVPVVPSHTDGEDLIRDLLTPHTLKPGADA